MVPEAVQLGSGRSWVASLLHLGLLSFVCSEPYKPAGTKAVKVRNMFWNNNPKRDSISF
jgi:hypothetical protein